MTIQDLLVHQFSAMYSTATRNLDGMTHAHSLVQPEPEGNCANWILGHLVNVHNGVMRVAGAEPVWESEQLARAGYDPIRNPVQAIDFESLKQFFLGSRDRCLSAIAQLTDEQIEEELPGPFGGMMPRGQLLGTLAFHQAYHIGQLGVIRRIAGLEGVIKAPGQPAA